MEKRIAKGGQPMTEFKYIFISQLAAILFFLGVALGSTVQEVKVVQLPPIKLPGQEFVMGKAMYSHDTKIATYDEKKRMWWYRDKKGRFCSLFVEKEED